jgi:hypothetical protein
MDRNGPFRASMLVLALAAAAAAVVVALLVAQAPAGAASDRLPDLRMARVQNLQIQNTGGRKLLRFDSIVVNAGAGPFELHGARAAGSSSDMTTRQRVFDDAGGFREVSTPAAMYFGGDGHNHWHVRDLEDFELVRLDSGRLAGTGAKHGFCFFDNYAYGSGDPAHYTGATGGGGACGGGAAATRTMMGLSVGWGDIYRGSLPDQHIDITGLTSGRYRLTARADAGNWFLETNNANNFSWIDIQLGGKKPRIVAYGPGA